ncbi:hypothetical protein [Ancylomarina subtilis]|nr:hypothetical protein [Ancylomarina subtilis]
MTKELMTIENSLMETISDNGAKDIISEMGELTLDAIIENDTIDQIPIIGTLKSIYKITNSISDHLFIQKLLKFINELGNLSEKEKAEMRSKIDNDKKYQNRIGESLLEIINKIDDSDKPEIIAKIFKSFISGFIELEEFIEFSQIVNRSYLPDLMNLCIFNSGQTLSNEYSGSLLSAGLIQIRQVTSSGEVSLRSLSEQEPYEYILNSKGEKLNAILIS